MATNYPTSKDDGTTLPNPSTTSKTNSPSHSALHANANDAIKAVQDKVGTGSSTPASNTFLIGNGSGTSEWSALTSAQLAARISDETGSGSAVFSSTPTLVTPKVDTINENTAANGVTIDGLNIKDGKLNTADSVDTANYTNGSIKPEHLQESTGTTWAYQTWTPTWTNLTVGNATVVARYIQIGKKVSYYVILTYGSTSAISGTVTFTLPVTLTANSIARFPIGDVVIEDSGTGSFIGIVIEDLSNGGKGEIVIGNTAGTYSSVSQLSSTVPMTWTTGDRILINGVYEAA